MYNVVVIIPKWKNCGKNHLNLSKFKSKRLNTKP